MSGASGRHFDVEMRCWVTEEKNLVRGEDGRRHWVTTKRPVKPVTERGGFVMLPHWWWSPEFRLLGKRCQWVWATMRREIRVAKGEAWHGKSFAMQQTLLAKKAGISVPTLIAVTAALVAAGLVVVTNRQVTSENSIYTLFDPEHVDPPKVSL